MRGIRGPTQTVLQDVMLDTLRKWLMLSLVAAVLAVMSVNFAVKTLGDGYPHLLSPFHFENKVQALVKLGKHYLQHPFIDQSKSTQELIRYYAKKNGVPYSMVMAVAQAESNLMPHRISSTGAMGVMQLMPSTAKDMKVEDPFNRRDNIQGGARYLRMLWKRYSGNKEKVAAAYNWGLGRVSKRKKLRGMPGETRHYVKKVLKLERKYRRQARK